MVLRPFRITPDVMKVAPAVRLADAKFPGFTLGMIIEEADVAIFDDKVDDVVTLRACEDEIADAEVCVADAELTACELKPPPRASAIATGKLVRPGLISAAGVTNFRTVPAINDVMTADPVGAAMTEVNTAFGSETHGAVTVT